MSCYGLQVHTEIQFKLVTWAHMEFYKWVKIIFIPISFSAKKKGLLRIIFLISVCWLFFVSKDASTELQISL